MLNLKSETLKFSISGMRGYVPEDLNAANIPLILSAFARSLPRGGIAVARDTRVSGPGIYHLALGSLAAMGRTVHDLGIVPTPTIKAYIHEHNLSGGLMISASHNPEHYNAFKFIAAKGLFFSERQNSLLQSYLKNPGGWAAYNKQGIIKEDEQDDANHLHIQSILKQIPVSKKKKTLKVAIDPVAACGSLIIRQLLDSMNIQYVSIHADFATRFPRKPEPVASSLAKLKHLVISEKCDAGFAVDPDADRLALVDNTGRAIGEELTLPLVLSQALNHYPGPVVVNLSTSWLNRYIAEQFNRKLYLSKVGEANVVAEMQKRKAVIGGEGNGGVIDLHIPSLGRDSLTGISWILHLLQSDKRPLDQVVDSLPARFNNAFPWKKAQLHRYVQKSVVFVSDLQDGV